MSQLSSSVSLPRLAYKGVPVVTTETLARAYEVEAKQIRQNFSNNKARFAEGKHFYSLSGNELREFKHRVENFDAVKIAQNVNALTLWTERGAARHAKMLNSDKAWDMFELLEETFFRVVRQPLPQYEATTPDTQPELSTTEDRKPLRALVGSWSQVSGLPFSACWNQLKAAFNLTDIRDLPREWIPDAIDWVQKRIDALPAPAQVAALAAAPSSVANDAEGHLAAIREHIGHIHRHEEALFKLARKALPPIRKPHDMFSPARRMGISAFQVMEDCDYTLDSSLKALESSIRLLLALERM